MNLTASDIQSIRRWIYRNARPLDLARWQYHFEGGGQEAVLAALAAYQNADGGFGNALEPDLWNPNSLPYVTQIAVNILEEIGFRDGDHPIVRGMLAYLEHGAGFDGTHWPTIVASTQDYPHAPWWTESAYDWGYTPTAPLAGWVLLYIDVGAPFYEACRRVVGTAIDTYLFGTMPDGSAYRSVRREGEIKGLARMLGFLEAVGIAEAYPLAEVRRVLRQQAAQFTEKDPAKWGQYSWRPSTFVRSPESPFYAGNEAAIEAELDYLLDRRNAEGVWDITWAWGAYDKAFAVAETWWKANLAIENLLLLGAFGRV